MKVSIVVPIYNSEKYLKRCINSILNQTYKNIEILLIDDGSDDNSGKICDRYSKRYRKIKVFHIQNSGVSNARNLGIQNSTGEYIQFVDSDDYIKSDMTEKLIKNALKYDSDMVMCSYKLISKYRTKIERVDKNNTYYNQNEFLYKLLEAQHYDYFNSPFNKLYKAELIKGNKILFDAKISLGEDLIFNLNIIRFGKRFSTVKESLYYYIVSDNPQSLTKKKRLDIWENSKLIFNKYVETYKYLGAYKKYKSNIDGMIIHQVDTLLNIIFNSNFYDSEINAILNNLFNDNILLNSINTIKLNSLHNKFIMWCIKYNKLKIIKFKFYIKKNIKRCIDRFRLIGGLSSKLWIS